MHLEKISLSHFKNYRQCDLQFSDHINCIVGPNGSGKTNLLDAIHYLSLTKSAFNSIDQQNIAHNEAFFAIRGVFSHEDKSNLIQCSAKVGSKKVIEKDKKPYTKLSEHIGSFPAVIITPYDTDIIREGSEGRRKFLNNMLSQIDAHYLESLIKYQNILKQRNQLLKNFAHNTKFDGALLQSYDEPLLALCGELHAKRDKFILRFVGLFKNHYHKLSEGSEQVNIHYRSHCHDQDFPDSFAEALSQDLALQRTTRGIHKDDLVCSINDYPIRKFGSQGQQKCFVIALKLAQFEILKEIKGFKPLLLLDDIFDKLDDLRIQKLMTMVASQVFGQIFITDARPERTSRILEKIPGDQRTFIVASGEVVEKL